MATNRPEAASTTIFEKVGRLMRSSSSRDDLPIRVGNRRQEALLRVASQLRRQALDARCRANTENNTNQSRESS